MKINEYIKNGIVKREGAWYYLIKEGPEKNVPLGTNLERANDKLEGLETKEPSPIKKELNTNLTKEIPKEQLKDMFSDLVANAASIISAGAGGDYSVFIFGVNFKKKDSSVIQNHDLVYYWHESAYTQQYKGDYANKWTVLRKTKVVEDPRTGQPYLKTARDDTPNEDYYTVNNHVLCYGRAHEFYERKRKEAEASSLRAAEVSAKRVEDYARAASNSHLDPEAAFKSLSQQHNNETISQIGRVKDQIKYGGDSEKLSKDLGNLQSMLNGPEGYKNSVATVKKVSISEL